ncbi:glycosyltransferase [Erysipelotrichaceae bacterium HCN-30851]
MNHKICLISFSNNVDHQNVIYSMFNALYSKYNIYTIGISNPKSNIAPKTENNLYVDCPLRPGITKGTFNFRLLLSIRKWIKSNNIKYLYFESQHIWNMFLMLMCLGNDKIVAVHDVIPHDGNKFMTLSNFVTCHLANHIVLRNNLFTDILSKKYHLKKCKISNFEPWRDYPNYEEPTNSKVILCFGRIRKYKGFDLFSEIINKTPEIKYRIVGEADKESKYLVDLVKDFNNVSLNDSEVSEDEMIKEFKDCDWVILPYSSATQSGVITDAYRLSRPVIAFDVGALREQIIDGKTGFLVPKGDVKSFVKKLNYAVNMNYEELENFSRNAYDFGSKKYSTKARAEEFYNLIINYKEGKK